MKTTASTLHLPGQRLILTVTTGRSGTEYLAHLLECSPGVECHHEPEPNFVDVMRATQSSPDIAREFWLRRKLPAIRTRGARIYAETSHLACKGFIEPLLELGICPDLVLLKRPHRAVALSLYRLRTIPGRTDEGLRWYLSPSDPGVLPLPDWERLHDYQLCYWYCLEIERRQSLYRKLVRDAGGHVTEVSIGELRTLRGFVRMKRELELPVFRVGPHDWYRYWARRTHRANTKAGQKHGELPLAQVEELEAELDSALSAPTCASTCLGRS